VTRDKIFALTVQTIVLVKISAHYTSIVKKAATIVAHAASLHEDVIPNEIDEAAIEFVDWYLSGGVKPEWVP
jgi:hypothetical protein